VDAGCATCAAHSAALNHPLRRRQPHRSPERRLCPVRCHRPSRHYLRWQRNHPCHSLGRLCHPSLRPRRGYLPWLTTRSATLGAEPPKTDER
jgi:hypothetical protein